MGSAPRRSRLTFSFKQAAASACLAMLVACLAMLVQSAAIVAIVSRQLSGGVRVQRLLLKPDRQLTKGLT